jgi:hypothetical protein
VEVEDIFICDEQTVSASASVDEVSLPIINEYEIEEIPFEPVDIKKLNSIPINDDQIIGPFNIGFDFNFFNESYSEFWISSNGYISFIEPSAGYNSHPIPNANGPYSTIFGAWEDWNPGEGGELRLGQFSNQLIIDFRNISSYNCGGNSDTAGTFQIILHKNSNTIDIYTINKYACTNSLQGIQGPNGQFAFAGEGRNSEMWSIQNSAVRFYPTNVNYIQWTDFDGNVIYNGNPLLHEVIESQAFIVQFTDNEGCISSDTLNLHLSLPTPSIINDNQYLFCELDGFEYQWYLSETLIEGANSQFYFPTQNGSYTVSATNNINCIEYSEAFEVTFTSINYLAVPHQKIVIKTIDMLGKEIIPPANVPFIEIYDDGSVEKKLIIEK